MDTGMKITGLTAAEVRDRLNKYGYNEIKEKTVNPFIKFLTYFTGPIPIMIEAAAVLSAVIKHWEDFWVIFALLMLNGVVGFWQEYKAGNAIDQLKKRLAPSARVLRDGKWAEIPARELVPGDLIRIRLGDIVPADARLGDGDELLIDESALTGESLPAEKHKDDTVYSGSIVKQGEMDAEVTATGGDSYFGRTARLVAEAKTESHFQRAVVKIGDYLIVLAVAIVFIVFLLALFRDESVLSAIQFALVLLVAAIPAALPAVLSITMVVGASALAKKEAIVSKLVAIEEMAGMDVLCSDKTGTITKNELTVSDVEPSDGYKAPDVFLYALLASREEDKDSIDSAIFQASGSIPEIAEDLASCSISDFKPFDPVSKRTEALVEIKAGAIFKTTKKIRVTKGAPQIILSLVGDTAVSDRVNARVNELASKGYRALGVAKSDDMKTWSFIGLIPMYDPPREDSAETIKTAESMGVAVKMVTGDHTAIAREIARQVDLGPDILPVTALEDKSDLKNQRLVEESDGFAQVYPEHKYHIVELLQHAGHIVGMTGDGVNDAPALKKADVGIAVAGATDAAKSAAAIVLTSPGLSVIIDGIKESRKIFQRMTSYAVYRIAETIRVLFFIALAIICFNFYPVTAMMIVLLALLNDIPIMAIAYDNVRYNNSAEKWQMRKVLCMATFLGIAGVCVTFSLFYIGETVLHLPKPVMQSFIFLKLAVAGHLTIFMTRTEGHFWSIRPAASLFWSAVITKIFATLVVVYGWYVAPIGWKLAFFVWAYALAEFIVTDYLKVYFAELLNHKDIKFQR
ncbi:MAG: plasma-membrane proton-efflux P-type ATPase [Candidatus Omnitrophota bacterium]